MTRKQRFLLPVLLAASAGMAFAGGKKQSGQYPFGEYDIAYGGATCSSPIAIASLKGFFDEEGVKITLVSGSTFEVDRTALAAGKMAVQNGDFQYFPAVHNG
ncbi:MAG: hypothetical protein LBS06_03120, partial [Treponema sp.]|nr:hypothetical protein [Treponema sp.]